MTGIHTNNMTFTKLIQLYFEHPAISNQEVNQSITKDSQK